MRSLGCGNLTGVDPFLPRDIRFQNGVLLLSQSVADLPDDPPFDLIMFNHSFEHVPDPHASMKAAARLLSDKGVIFIRTPTVDSYAWRHYGVDWVQLDAPRHFFIHSRRSLEYLAEAAGLELYEVVYDSTDFQFWGSEQYRRDIALNADNSYAINPARSIFTWSDIRSFRRRAEELNRNNDGDQAAYYFRKKK
jgi:SAM-dependent methyltransferase